MGVTNNKSTQVAALLNTPTPLFEAYDTYGKLRLMRFDLTVSGAGDANSTFELVKLPAGKVTIVGQMSFVKHSAFGTGATLDVGLSAYRAPLAASDTAADEDALHSAADVAAAGSFAPADELAVGMVTITSTTGVTVTAKVETAGVPDAATLKGYIVIAVE